MVTVINFLLALLSASALFDQISGQNPSGFISLDCRLPANSSYIEPTTRINYDSDAAFIDSGTAHNISADNIKTTLKQQLWSLRSFPQGIRNCYKLKVKSGTKYLIRASFLYGNYDAQRKLPGFDLYFGVNLWESLVFYEIGVTVHKEIIHVTKSSDLQVCVVNTGSGTPFISALELRPLRNSVYETGSRSLSTFLRLDGGSINNQTYRYKDDVYDRIWVPMVPLPACTSISTSEQVAVHDPLFFHPTPAVMNSAATPINATAPMAFNWLPAEGATGFFVYMYFAEIQKLQANESRKFDILLDGKRWYNSSISPKYLSELVVYSSSPVTVGTYDFALTKTVDSTLPPILNAIEIYSVINFPQSETTEQDAEAIANAKKIYGITRNWQGDPCAPREFIWQGVNCSSVDSKPPRIISFGLTGEIAQDIAKKTVIPDFYFSDSTSTHQRLKIEIEISFDWLNENLNLFTTALVVAASVGGFVLLSFIKGAIFWIRAKHRKQQGAVFGEVKQDADRSQPWETTKRHYSYADIVRITNNFEWLLGEDGFGRVYYGRIGNTEVAVKMLSPGSAQQFQAEVDLLMRVHHRNLTGLVGYSNDSTTKGLIYEYMARGNLESLISGGKLYLLNWEERLHIEVDAAHGLEYLHTGIRPIIVHGDVKSSNILLDENFRAKVSDFGLSRIFPTDGRATHVTTNVVDTHSYLDLEYYASYRLTEKSDVYGFGVILLEMITGKPALTRNQDQMIHIYQWVGLLLSQGDIRSIIDPKMIDDYDVNTIWKAVDIAMSCASHKSSNRPNMSQVVVELNECLAMELAARSKDHQPQTAISDSASLFNPSAR